jgi:FAD/FMN-containing dehydrogenase
VRQHLADERRAALLPAGRDKLSSTVMSALPAPLRARFAELLGAEGVLEEPAAMAPYMTDWRKLFRGSAAAVLRPRTTAETAAVVGFCAEAGVPIVPQGGNTGLVGGATPSAEGREIVLSLGRMNRIRSIDAENFTLTAEAGAVLQTVQQTAADADRLFPLSLGAEGQCQIGGNVSTNAGGIAVLRYGNMRELVLGLEVVLPSGEIWDGLRALRKDNTGYDLKQFFIGAEGTLGIVTAAVLKLFPRPAEKSTAFVGVRDPAHAVTLLARCRAESGDNVTSFELISRPAIDLALHQIPTTVDPLADPYPYYALIELTATARGTPLRMQLESALETALADGLIADATIAESEAAARRLWHVREAVVEAQRLEGPSIKHDIAVPISKVAGFIDQAAAEMTAAMPGVRPIAFGHLGDGNIHFNLTAPPHMTETDFFSQGLRLTRMVHDRVASVGGSISAEHGLGQLRRDEIRRYKPAIELATMRRIKAALDPRGIMNPGKML